MCPARGSAGARLVGRIGRGDGRGTTQGSHVHVHVHVGHGFGCWSSRADASGYHGSSQAYHLGAWGGSIVECSSWDRAVTNRDSRSSASFNRSRHVTNKREHRSDARRKIHPASTRSLDTSRGRRDADRESRHRRGRSAHGRHGARRCVVLVDLDGIDFPVRVLERARVLRDIVNTALGRVTGAAGWTVRLGEHGAGPVSAEGSVEDDPLLVEPLCEVAGSLEEGRGHAERGHVGVAVGDGRRDRGAREEPDRDVRRCQLHGVHPSAEIVERGTDVVDGGLHSAAEMAISGVALSGHEGAGHSRVCHQTVGAGVENDLAACADVDPLDDIDLAIGRPVGADSPEGWPGATDASGHVLDVGDE